jgi:hypothetical protein
MERTAAGIAFVLMMASFAFESTPLYAAATVAAIGAAVVWMRNNAPHDHWKGFKRRR